jgi:hypothetical protein
VGKRVTVKMAIDALTEVFTGERRETASANCTLLSSEPVTCPLCQARVAAGELHTCTRSHGGPS